MSTKVPVRNPVLYNKLKQIFGEVKVANRGSVGSYINPDFKVKKRLSKRKRGEKLFASVENWGEVYRVCCPCCGDTRFRLFFSYMCASSINNTKNKQVYFSSGIFDCKNEKCREELSPYVGRLSEMGYPNISEILPAEVEVASRKTMCRYLSIDVTLPSHMQALIRDNLSTGVINYLEGRGFNIEELSSKYSCQYIPKGSVWVPPKSSSWVNSKGEAKFTFREESLFIPIIQSRRIVGWQARLLRETTKADLKYMTMPGSVPCIYNFDNALVHDNIMLVEGVTDVWKCGDASMALLGARVKGEQMECLRVGWGMTGKAILVVEEESTQSTINSNVSDFIEQGIFPGGIIMIYFDGKDPGELSREYLDKVREAAYDIMPVEDPNKVYTVTEILNIRREKYEDNKTDNKRLPDG